MAAASSSSCSRNEFHFVENLMKAQKEFDETFVERKLKETEYLLKYLKNTRQSVIPHKIKMKLSNINEKFDNLLMYWESSDRDERWFKNKHISEDLWDGNFLLKYLFENNVEYTEFVSERGFLPQLYCNVCRENFVCCNSENLFSHLLSKSHLENFNKTKLKFLFDNDTIWNNNSIMKSLFEKYICFKQSSNKYYCKICCIDFNCTKINFIKHLQCDNHLKNFKDVVCFDENDPNEKINVSVKEFLRSTCVLGEKITEGDYHKLHNDDRNSVKENTFFSCVNTVLPEEKSVVLEEKYDNNNIGLAINVRILLENLLKNPEKILNENNHFCGFFCNLCNYWTNDGDYWNNHISNNEMHKYNHVINKENNLKLCDCKIVIICDDKFYNEHISSFEHTNLKRFILNKSVVNNNNKEKIRCEEITGNSSQKLPISDDNNGDLNELKCEVNSDEESNEFDYDSDAVSDTCSIWSSASQSSVSSSRSRPQFGSQSSLVSKRDLRSIVCGLKDLPDGTIENDISKVFKLFGTVKSIDFVESKSANVYLLLSDESRRNTIFGTKVVIKDKEICITRKISLSFQLPPFVTTLFSTVNKFNEGTNELYERAQFVAVMTGVDGRSRGFSSGQRTRSDMITEIKTDIKNSYSKIQRVTQIGSRATGLANGSSLLDIFVNIDDNYFGNKTQDAIILMTHAVEIYSALKKSHKFEEVNIIGDQSPVVHVLHKKFKMECRLYFHNGLVVENTKLINLYLQFDNKIRCLLLVVREWAEHTKLTNILSQYAITWMVLYYLMTGKSPVIHPVIFLRSCNKNGRTFIAGWDCRFCDDLSEIRPLQCKKSFRDLLYGFFLFYSVTNNIKFVHSPLTGKMYLKKHFNNLHLPAPFSKYKLKVQQNLDEKFVITNGICLQDPLALNVNLTQNLVGIELQKFRWYCSQSAARLRRLFYKQ